MHPLSGALPLQFVPACVNVVLWLVMDVRLRFLAVELISTAGHFMHFAVSVWNDFNNHVCEDVGLARFKSSANAI